MTLLPKLNPCEVPTDQVTKHILVYEAAYRLAEKLSTLTWADRDKGFQAWSALVDQLNDHYVNRRAR